MKKYLQRLLYLSLSILFLLVIGCKSNLEEDATEKKIDLGNIKRIDIPLDESSATGEASLTRNFYFIFDGSGSMDDPPDKGCSGDQSFSRKIDGAKWAIQEFIKKVPDDINLGLYIFDSNYVQKEVIPLGNSNRQRFLEVINQVRAGGQTPLAEAIHFATDQLVKQYKKQLGYGEYRLVVITDGMAENIPEASLYAAQYGIPIYAIGLCIGQDHPLRQYALSYRAADNFTDLARGLEETVAESQVFDAKEFE
ncbi:MAG: vWA domain-containing protein [bacterium]